MSEDSADGAARRPTISVSVPPRRRAAFSTALACLRQAHGDGPVSESELIVNAVIQQADALDAPSDAPDQPLIPHVLIVDDDDMIRETLRMILEGAGYVVAEAAEGLSALSQLNGSPYRQVVLLDNRMPGLDANELLEALETNHTRAGADWRHAFILITASPKRLSSALVARLARLGAPVIAKPFDLVDLLETIARLAPPQRA